MMVGDQDVNASCARGGHTVGAGDPVVDGDDQSRVALSGDGYDLWRQSITKFEAIGYDVPHVGTERAQAPQGDGTRGGTVGIVIGNDHNALATVDRTHQAITTGRNAFEAPWRWEIRQPRIGIYGAPDPPRCVQASEQRRNAGSNQCVCGVGIERTLPERRPCRWRFTHAVNRVCRDSSACASAGLLRQRRNRRGSDAEARR